MRVFEKYEYDEDGNTTGYFIGLSSDSGFERKLEFTYSEDCPEDATIDRDYRDVKNIKTLINEAYEAGRRGELLDDGGKN